MVRSPAVYAAWSHMFQGSMTNTVTWILWVIDAFNFSRPIVLSYAPWGGVLGTEHIFFKMLKHIAFHGFQKKKNIAKTPYKRGEVAIYPESCG